MRFNNDYRTITLSKRKYNYGPRWYTQLMLALLVTWNVLVASGRNQATINHARMIVLVWAVGVLAIRTVPFILETIAAGYIDQAIGA